MDSLSRPPRSAKSHLPITLLPLKNDSLQNEGSLDGQFFDLYVAIKKLRPFGLKTDVAFS